MGRARRARKIAATAAYGGGGVAAIGAALGAAGWGVIQAEAALARRVIGAPFDDSPDDNGVYGSGRGEPFDARRARRQLGGRAGHGCRHQTVGAIVASGVAALTGRRVRLTNRAVVGAESSGLERQLANALEEVMRPDVVLIMVGANDVTHRIERRPSPSASSSRPCGGSGRSARRSSSAPVPTSAPSSRSASRCAPWCSAGHATSRPPRPWPSSRRAGAPCRSATCWGPSSRESPHEMFSKDRFHPSAAGYARAAAALLPSVCAALGVWGADTTDRPPEPRRGEGVGPVAVAAGQAVKEPGTEVSPTQIAGQSRGPRGRWAVTLRRRHDQVPPAEDTPVATEGEARASTEAPRSRAAPA